jgi:hypothetical protein
MGGLLRRWGRLRNIGFFCRDARSYKSGTKRLLNTQSTDLDSAMKNKVSAEPKVQKKKVAKFSFGDTTPYGGVSESSLPARGTDKKVEQMLSDIVTRLERIEEKIDENVYPPESAIKPEFIKRVKKAQAEIAKGKGKTYESMDVFIKAISE